MRDEFDQRIIDAADSSGRRLAQTLQDLIRFESVVMSDPTKAGPGERLCQEYLGRRLKGIEILLAGRFSLERARVAAEANRFC